MHFTFEDKKYSVDKFTHSDIAKPVHGMGLEAKGMTLLFHSYAVHLKLPRGKLELICDP
jgi:hypothetical protein